MNSTKKECFNITRMFNRNKIWAGAVLGIILPVTGFGILYSLFQFLDRADAISDIGLSEDFRLRTIGIVAIALNAILLNRFQKRRATQTMRGIVIVTFFWVMLWLYFFKNAIL